MGILWFEIQNFLNLLALLARTSYFYFLVKGPSPKQRTILLQRAFMLCKLCTFAGI